jgi:predicted AlkP superfamily phosphohydrolase/phosphomutase
VLSTVGLADAVADVMPTDVIRAGTEQVDFANSSAYMRDRIELGIRLNVVGRDPDGMVPRDDYEAVRESLVASLTDLTTPDGEPVFETVSPREAVYEGPHVDEAPDIVLVPDGFDHFLSGSLRGDRFGPPTEPWNHKRMGILVAAGPDIEAAAMTDERQPQLFDVAPTVLATLGVAPSDRMDGRTLPLADSLDEHSYPEFNARETRTRDSSEVEQHLADLGYLEDV